MAKKKTRKKRNNKSQLKLNSNRKKLREDFEVFAKGVERLEELRAELNSLNTKGYEAEAGVIRSKLKNVSYIPEIEREMRVLKQKIKGGVVEKRIVNANALGIKRKIKELESEIKRKKKVSVKKQLSKDEIKMVRAIPRLEGQLVNFKRFIQEQEADERRKKELLKKIDPSVNFLINDRFNLSLNEIKAELSKRIKNKELTVEEKLHDDLELRRKDFENKYNGLVKRFEEKYRQKVDSSLQSEVKKRFNEVLMQRVSSLRRGLERTASARLKERQKQLDEKERIKLLELDKEKDKIKKQLEFEASEELKKEKERFKLKKEKISKKIKLEASEELKKEEERMKDILNTKEISDFKKKEKELKSKLSVKFSKIVNSQRNYLKKKEKLLNNFERKKKNVLRGLSKKHYKLRELIRVEKQKELEQHKKELRVKITREQLQRLRNQLIKEVESKKRNLKNSYDVALTKEKKKLRKDINDKILTHKVNLDNNMHKHLTEEVGKIHRKFDERKRQEEKRIEEMKERLKQEGGFLAKVKDNLSAERKKIREDKENYKAEVKERLEKEKQDAIRKSVAEQSAFIRDRLKREFDSRLKLEIKAKEAEFEKKKADLALNVQRKAKELFS